MVPLRNFAGTSTLAAETGGFAAPPSGAGLAPVILPFAGLWTALPTLVFNVIVKRGPELSGTTLVGAIGSDSDFVSAGTDSDLVIVASGAGSTRRASAFATTTWVGAEGRL